jgi:hypothetical protein
VRFIDEVLADCFSLEQGYRLDFMDYCHDFDRIRSKHQDPAMAGGFRDTYEARRLASLLYCWIRYNPAPAHEVTKRFAQARHELDTNTAPGNVELLVPAMRGHLDSMIDSVSALSGLASERNRVRGFLLEGILPDFEMTVRRLMRQSSPAEVLNLQFLLWELLYKLATGALARFRAVMRPVPTPAVPNGFEDVFRQLGEGHLASCHVDRPFDLLKLFISYCSKKHISLEREDAASVRAAVIHLLCGEVRSEAEKLDPRRRNECMSS